MPRTTGSTYSDAVTLLNSTQTGWKILEERRRLGIKLAADVVDDMRKSLRYIGHSPSDLDRINIAHVAGTKGKGTTCAFINSILHQYHKKNQKPRKYGLYTSPHLIAVRERIRINSEPISEELFAKYFFEVWDRYEASAKADGQDPSAKPTYFRFVTLLSFHVFLREEVDTAIYEVGVGGELDATNVFEKPAVTGITTLGIDHIEQLGDTIEKIAWHKAGILKEGCPAFIVDQLPSAMDVVLGRAKERGVNLVEVALQEELRKVDIKPKQDFQLKNASMAVMMTQTILAKLGIPLFADESAKGPTDATTTVNEGSNGDAAPQSAGQITELPQEFIDGLTNVVWRGRGETKVTGDQTWHLDGAHNEQSLRVACRWFANCAKDTESDNIPCVLVFNQQSTRDATGLLKIVHETVYETYPKGFATAVFCTNLTYKDHSFKVDFVNHNVNPDDLRALSLQQKLADEWRDLDPQTESTVAPTIQDTIEFIRWRFKNKPVRVLITGSFHLLGGALSILEGGEDFALASTAT